MRKAWVLLLFLLAGCGNDPVRPNCFAVQDRATGELTEKCTAWDIDGG